VKRMNACAVLPLLCAAMLAASAARADAPERCAAIADDRARLACYDALFGKPDVSGAVGAPPSAAPVTADAATATAAATAGATRTPEADFGLTEAAKRAREPEATRAEFPESISGTVAAVGRRPAGEIIVTLANGQVWVQVHVDARARIDVGDTVTIKKAALGSHLLVTANRYATRVRRVK